MDTDEHGFNRVTERAIGCSYRVANELGAGYFENVYENAPVVELRETGLTARQQHSIAVRYKGQIVGENFADILVEDAVLVELKAVGLLEDFHMAQCLNYLKATGLKICLLLNFGKPRIEIKRIAN